MKLGLRGGILLAVVNLLAGNIGDLSAPFRDCLAFALWLPVLVSVIRPCFLRAGWPRKFTALLVLVPVVLGFRAGGVHAVFALFLTLWLPCILQEKSSPTEPHLPVLLLTTASVGLWMLIQDLLPQAFVWVDRLSFLSCKLSSLVSTPQIAFGPTYSGIPIFLTLVLFHLSAFALIRPRRARRLGAVLGGQLFLLLAYQVGFHRLLAHWQLGSSWVQLGVAQLGLLLTGCALIPIQIREAAFEATPCQVKAPGLAWLAVVSVLLFVSLGEFVSPWLGVRTQPRVLLYDDGTLDWSVPAYGRYSGAQGGMFGSLQAFLKRHQCEAMRGPLKDDALDKANVLVVFNLMHKFSAAEKRQIWEFIGKGGSLLAVGDHTGTTAIREPFNDLLEPVNIGFNFDCAMPIRASWANAFRLFPHYVTANLESEADTEIHVGASLSVRSPAEPLIIGTHAWSDKGDLQNPTNGFLGDRRFSIDERLGDVVLVATAKYKAGKVMVFGDTSTFQNGALARAGDFAQAVFQWLPMKERRPWRLVAMVLLACAAAGAFRALYKARTSLLVTTISLFACFYLGYTALALACRGSARSGAGSPVPGEALIDVSHLSRCDPVLWQPDGLGGLVQNLMRKNYFPFVATHFSSDLLRQGKLSFLVAPAKRFTARECAAYEEFVRHGGELFICVGYEDASACGDLLARFGFKLRNLPLGPLGPDSNDVKIYFLNAWPVVAESGETDVLCRQGEYALIVSRRYGQGRVVLIGDSGFFLNRNLEMAESFNPENIQFFRQLVPAHE